MTPTKTKPVPKLSTVPRGYWRNAYVSRGVAPFRDGAKHGPGFWFANKRQPSAEIAEMRALENMRRYPEWVRDYGVTYLGPEFFPESEGEGQ